MSKYTVREKCIFCNTFLDNLLFLENNYETFVAHYSVEENNNQKFQKIPFNISVCNNCKTPQLKYLGDVKEIYKINHADSTGKIMQRMHDNFLNFIYQEANAINGIVEIGSSKGVLADKILDKIKTEYTIVDPSYFGNKDNKIIIEDFYENVDDCKINANTIIISHVLEHFYEPMQIIKKIADNKKIEKFFLIFPDFEHYINNGILHCLNTEHTFYVDNEFLESIIHKFGFSTIKKYSYEGHSVFFYFERNKEINSQKNNEKILINLNYNLDKFYKKIYSNIKVINELLVSNPNKKIYLFPASNHSIYLSIFGLKYKLLKGFLDNSKLKIGKNIYGLNCKIFSFEEIINSEDESVMIIINGGIFNKEIESKLINKKINYYKCN